ncbi:hypothetical protein GCM10010399_42690 [Dactylosporangium fulvum]
MAVIYDHAVTDARRRVERHRPTPGPQVTSCSAGCGRWPCKPFSTAWVAITRNSHTRADR